MRNGFWEGDGSWPEGSLEASYMLKGGLSRIAKGL